MTLMCLKRYSVIPDVDRAGRYGLRTWDIAGTIRTAIHGTETAKYRVGEDEYDIIVRYLQPFRGKVEDVENAVEDVEGEVEEVIDGANGDTVRIGCRNGHGHGLARVWNRRCVLKTVESRPGVRYGAGIFNARRSSE